MHCVPRYFVATYASESDKIGDQCVQITQFIGLWANFLKPCATINLPKSPTFFGIFCKGVKIYHFSSEIIFGQLL